MERLPCVRYGIRETALLSDETKCEHNILIPNANTLAPSPVPPLICVLNYPDERNIADYVTLLLEKYGWTTLTTVIPAFNNTAGKEILASIPVKKRENILRKKIDIADAIYVIDYKGRVDRDTIPCIAYAEFHQKEVYYMTERR